MVVAFPARQHGVNSAEFIRWTKSLNVSEAKGQKFEDLLKNSLDKVELDYELRVLCNDSTACLYTGLGRSSTCQRFKVPKGTRGDFQFAFSV